MKQHSLPMHDDQNRKADSVIKDMKSSREVSLKGQPLPEEGMMFNPIVQMDLASHKKHHAVAPLKKESQKIVVNDYKPVNVQDEKNIQEIIKNKVNEKPKAAGLVKSSTNKEDIKIQNQNANQKKEETNKSPSQSKDKRWKNVLLKIVDNNFVLLFMTALTIFALFSNDIQTAFCPASVDFPFDVIQCILFCLFTFEIILTCLCKDDYIFSFFFWLDVISTLSLIQDISFIFDKILDSGTAVENDPTLNKKAQKASNTVSKVTSASR